VSRGDLVTIALPGDYGKPRPALVVQADAFRALASATVLPLTSDLHDWPPFRITIRPSRSNGLRQASQVAVDKTATAPRAKIGQRTGRADAATMRAVDLALAGFLGLGDPRSVGARIRGLLPREQSQPRW
jgi:mRNA interferase MazF